MKELKRSIERLDKELDEMNERRNKWTKREEEQFDEKNNERYQLAIILENEQLKAKIKRLEKKLKEKKQ